MPKPYKTSDFKKTIGSLVRQQRRSLSMTLKDVEASTGINNGNLSRIERGEEGFSDTRLEIICMSLKTTLWGLITDGVLSDPARRKLLRYFDLADDRGKVTILEAAEREAKRSA